MLNETAERLTVLPELAINLKTAKVLGLDVLPGAAGYPLRHTVASHGCWWRGSPGGR